MMDDDLFGPLKNKNDDDWLMSPGKKPSTAEDISWLDGGMDAKQNAKPSAGVGMNTKPSAALPGSTKSDSSSSDFIDLGGGYDLFGRPIEAKPGEVDLFGITPTNQSNTQSLLSPAKQSLAKQGGISPAKTSSTKPLSFSPLNLGGGNAKASASSKNSNSSGTVVVDHCGKINSASGSSSADEDPASEQTSQQRSDNRTPKTDTSVSGFQNQNKGTFKSTGDQKDVDAKSSASKESSQQGDEGVQHFNLAEDERPQESGVQVSLGGQFNYQAFFTGLKHPSASETVGSMSLFVRKITKIQEERTAKIKDIKDYDLEQYDANTKAIVQNFHQFIAKTHKKLLEVEVYEGANEETRMNCLEGIEKFIATKVYGVVFRMNPEDEKRKDDMLYTKITALKWIQAAHLDLELDVVQHPKINSAKEYFDKLNEYKAPRDKLVCLTNGCKMVGQVLEEKKGNKGAGLDDLLPHLIFLIIQVNPPKLSSNLNYIENFRTPSRLVEEGLYYLTAVRSAVEFLLALEHDVLSGISEEEFQFNCEDILKPLGLKMPKSASSTNKKSNKSSPKKGNDTSVAKTANETSAAKKEKDTSAVGGPKANGSAVAGNTAAKSSNGVTSSNGTSNADKNRSEDTNEASSPAHSRDRSPEQFGLLSRWNPFRKKENSANEQVLVEGDRDEEGRKTADRDGGDRKDGNRILRLEIDPEMASMLDHFEHKFPQKGLDTLTVKELPQLLHDYRTLSRVVQMMQKTWQEQKN